QRTFRDVDADVGRGHPGRGVPVDAPDVVAWLVGPDLGELRAAAEVPCAELARDEAADAAPDREVERAQERLRRGAGSRLRRRAEPRREGGHAVRSSVIIRGAGTCGMIRSRSMSGVTSSARAEKLGTMRWRRTSGASSAMSAGTTYRRPRSSARARAAWTRLIEPR